MRLWESATGSRMPSVEQWREDVLGRIGAGQRFAGLYGTDLDGACQLTALIAEDTDLASLHTLVQPGRDGSLRYPCLAGEVPAAFWYERALHDLSGVVPDGHPRLDPLLLRLPDGMDRPRPGMPPGMPPGTPSAESRTPSEERAGTSDVAGHGIFSLPFGPVRSGVMESIEFLIETPGEDIPYLNIRPHYKHRGIAKRFEQSSLADGLLVAERVEGISSVAHALAYCHAVEKIGSVMVPRRAALIRVVYAELERIANHLDVTMRLADAAGLAVATARFGWHKETVMRLVSRLAGNRFGRGVVAIGGVHHDLPLPSAAVAEELAVLHTAVRSDLAALESSASFLDRLRGTGPLPAARARAHGALGPIGRASGFDDDDRRRRPYDGYGHLAPGHALTLDTCDAVARARVRWREIDTSVAMISTALDELDASPTNLRGPAPASGGFRDGFGVGWAESAQGEVLYGVELAQARVRRCFARSASFHNLVLFHDVFAGDIFTDFPFIEASFGLCYAGVAM